MDSIHSILDACKSELGPTREAGEKALEDWRQRSQGEVRARPDALQAAHLVLMSAFSPVRGIS